MELQIMVDRILLKITVGKRIKTIFRVAVNKLMMYSKVKHKD